MKRVILVPLMFILIASQLCLAQDLHYSQFFNSPLNISPGLTGNFNGDHRVGLNLRQQWKSVPVDYKSITLSYDYKNSSRHTVNHFNYGLLLNYDDTGDLGLQHIGINAVMSYSIRVADKIHVSPGLGFGLVQKRYDSASATSANQWDGLQYDPSIPAEFIGNDNYSYLNFTLGASLRYWKGERSYLDVGGSVYNINTEDQSYNNGATYLANLAPRLNGFLMANWKVGRKLDVLANAVFQSQKPHKETLLNGQVKYYIDNKFTTALYLGAGIRLNDAWYPMIAFSYYNIYGALTYDVNFSDFDVATDNEGGPELTFKYTLAKVPFYPKKPCPIY